MSIIELIAGWLLKWLAGWLGARSAAREQQRAADNQAFADTDTAAIREHAAVATQTARESTDEAVAAAGAEPDPGRLRDNVQAAIERANAVSSVR